MAVQPASVCETLKNFGFKHGTQMRLYGETFEIAGEPIVVSDNFVLVNTIEGRSGKLKQVRVPLPMLKMATDRAA